MKLSDIVGQDAIDELLESGDDILQGKLELAEKAAEYARSIAPVDSGDYKEGIKVRRYGRTGVGVVWTAEHSSYVEYGTEDTPEFAIRRKTIEHFGGDGQ